MSLPCYFANFARNRSFVSEIYRKMANFSANERRKHPFCAKVFFCCEPQVREKVTLKNMMITSLTNVFQPNKSSDGDTEDAQHIMPAMDSQLSRERNVLPDSDHNEDDERDIENPEINDSRMAVFDLSMSGASDFDDFCIIVAYRFPLPFLIRCLLFKLIVASVSDVFFVFDFSHNLLLT